MRLRSLDFYEEFITPELPRHSNLLENSKKSIGSTVSIQLSFALKWRKCFNNSLNTLSNAL